MSSTKFTKGGLAVKSLKNLNTGNGHNQQAAESPLSSRGNIENPYTYEVVSESANYIKKRISHVPKIALICGTGLGNLATMLDEKTEFPYSEIPHFPQSTVSGHAGKLIVGKMGNVHVVCMQGRFHYFEGYPLWKVAMPIRVFKLLGVELLFVTNAAGGLNPNYNVGDIMFIKDHINFPGFSGESFLRGPNDERFGPRFVAMNNCYDGDLRKLAKSVAEELDMQDFVHEGVYTMVGGPCFETVAELKIMKLMGIDAVGMSTVPEVTAARHCGIKCFGFSLITNVCVLDYDTDDEPDHELVLEAASKREGDLLKFVTAFLNAIETGSSETDESEDISE